MCEDIVHQPAAGSMGLQAWRGDHHANCCKVISKGKPHGGGKDAPDAIHRDDALTCLAQHLTVLGSVRPTNAKGERVKLFDLDVGNITQHQLERFKLDRCLCLHHLTPPLNLVSIARPRLASHLLSFPPSPTPCPISLALIAQNNLLHRPVVSALCAAQGRHLANWSVRSPYTRPDEYPRGSPLN